LGEDFKRLVNRGRIHVEVGHPALTDAAIDERKAAATDTMALEMGRERWGDGGVNGHKDHIGLRGFDG
jgi:hypothetical protein